MSRGHDERANALLLLRGTLQPVHDLASPIRRASFVVLPVGIVDHVVKPDGGFERISVRREVTDEVKLPEALADVLAMPDVKKRILDLGTEPRGSTPQEILSRMQSDITKWGAVIEQAKIEKR